MSNQTLGITSNGVKEGSLDHFIDVLAELTGRDDKDALADECFDANGKRGVRIEMNYLPMMWREALKIADSRQARIAELERQLAAAVDALEWLEEFVDDEDKSRGTLWQVIYTALAQIRGGSTAGKPDEAEVRG